MTPSLREIRMFVAVLEEQSFTAAAAREYATQSGVSQHIRSLEDRLGMQLLDRSNGVRPTAAGSAYYVRCLEVLKAHAQARRSLVEFSTGLGGSIVVGLLPTITRAVLAPAFLRFNAQHPNVSLRVVEAYSDILANHLRAGELDFAILPRSEKSVAGIKTTLFARSPEFLVSSPECGLVDGAPVRLAEVDGLKLVMPGRANPRRPRLERYLSEGCVQLDSQIEFDTVPGTLDLVARSDWRVIFPGVMVASEMGQGRYRINPLADPPMWLELFLAEPERQPLSPAAVAFVDGLREVTDELNREPCRVVENRLTHAPD